MEKTTEAQTGTAPQTTVDLDANNKDTTGDPEKGNTPLNSPDKESLDVASEVKIIIGQPVHEAAAELPPKEADIDPWALPVLQDQGVKWSELTPREKGCRCLTVTLKVVSLIGLLYLFICSLDFLSSAFRLVGGKTAGQVMSQNELLRNPVVGLMLGILATVLVQSSSTSTSIVVTMVGSGLLNVRHGIPIIMGANIGTSVTNTIVSLVQVGDRNEFRRAFAAATVHDMFNWLTVIILLPIEVSTHYLEKMTEAIVNTQDWSTNKETKIELLTVLTKPFTNLIIQLDKKVIEDIANGKEEALNKSMIKRCCDKVKLDNCSNPCQYALAGLNWNDSFVGILLLCISLVLLCGCLIMMVKLLHSMMRGHIANVIRRTVNTEYRFPYSMLIGYGAILIGCIMTILVQSSSIFTSALTPLAGMGVISLERMYPLTLGSNIGTTTTGILAALATTGKDLRHALQISFCHMFFNVTGIALFYPIPYLRFPIGLAKGLGNTTAKYRWFSIFYLLLMFVMLPAAVFALSLAGSLTFIIVGSLILIIFVFACVLNILQRKRPAWLPLKLQNWNWLPEWMHSLDPLDRVIVRVFGACGCCNKLIRSSGSGSGGVGLGIRPNQSQINILQQDRRSSTPTEKHPMNGLDNSAFYWQQENNRTDPNAQNTNL